jgi:hypothetical protein
MVSVVSCPLSILSQLNRGITRSLTSGFALLVSGARLLICLATHRSKLKADVEEPPPFIVAHPPVFPVQGQRHGGSAKNYLFTFRFSLFADYLRDPLLSPEALQLQSLVSGFPGVPPKFIYCFLRAGPCAACVRQRLFDSQGAYLPALPALTKGLGNY